MPFNPSTFTPPSVFPTYLIPSLPFRRRSSGASSQSATTSSSSSTNNGNGNGNDNCKRYYLNGFKNPPRPSYLSGSRAHLRCNRCFTDLCFTSQIISKGFTGRHGRAYLVAAEGAPVMPPIMPPAATVLSTHNLPNIHTHKAVPRQLVTGPHTVSDISCVLCGTVLGWKYVAAEDEGQRYKIGKFVLETKRVCRGVCWENERLADAGEGFGAVPGWGKMGSEESGAAGEAFEFDSQDEDECEDLFAGVWSPQLAAKRRKNRSFKRKLENLG